MGCTLGASKQPGAPPSRRQRQQRPLRLTRHAAVLAAPQEWRASPQGHQPMIESQAVTQQGWGEGGALAAKLVR